MENPIINLATINAISDPYRAVILETITQRKHASFKELLEITKLSNDGLTIQLEKLQKYALIKGELTDPKGGSYSFYRLTKLGEQFRSILHDALEKSNDVKPDPISDKFVIDAESFLKILEKRQIDGLKKIFDHCKIVCTNRDYSILTQLADKLDNESLRDFLDDEKLVIISETYNDVDNSARIEHHLRRAKKLQNEARLVVTAIDTGASLITNNERIASAARSMGVMCGNTDAVLELKEDDYLWEKFYELSLQKSDAKNVVLHIQNNPLSILKKN